MRPNALGLYELEDDEKRVSLVNTTSQPRIVKRRDQSTNGSPSTAQRSPQPFCTPSRLSRLFIVGPNDDSPTTSNIPSLAPGSSPSSAMTTSPTSPSSPPRRISYSPLTTHSNYNGLTISHTNSDSRFTNFAAVTEQDGDLDLKGDNTSLYIHSWLQQTSSFLSTSPTPEPMASPQQLLAVNGSSLLGAPISSLESTQRSSSSAPSYSDKDLAGILEDERLVNFFGRDSLDLHFDLETHPNRITVDEVSARSDSQQQTQHETLQKLTHDKHIQQDQTLEYVPELDGIIEDEHILRRHRRNPWPYDRAPLMPPSQRPTDNFTRAPSKLSSLIPQKRKRDSVGFRPAIHRTASKLAMRASSFLSTKPAISQTPDSEKTSRIPNSAVPHPDWGTFTFRSDSDSLCSDDDDGDVEVWLTRVVRRNLRAGKASFEPGAGHCQMTIEEYERSGSWLVESGYDELDYEEDFETEESGSANRPRSSSPMTVSSGYNDNDISYPTDDLSHDHEESDMDCEEPRHGDAGSMYSRDSDEENRPPSYDIPEICLSTSSSLDLEPLTHNEHHHHYRDAVMTSYVTTGNDRPLPIKRFSASSTGAGRSLRKAITKTLQPLLSTSRSTPSSSAPLPATSLSASQPISSLEAYRTRTAASIKSKLSYLALVPRLSRALYSRSTSETQGIRVDDQNPFEMGFRDHLGIVSQTPEQLAEALDRVAYRYEEGDEGIDRSGQLG